MGVWGLRPQRVQGRALAFLGESNTTPIGIIYWLHQIVTEKPRSFIGGLGPPALEQYRHGLRQHDDKIARQNKG